MKYPKRRKKLKYPSKHIERLAKEIDRAAAFDVDPALTKKLANKLEILQILPSAYWKSKFN